MDWLVGRYFGKVRAWGVGYRLRLREESNGMKRKMNEIWKIQNKNTRK
jgi:hypothetical protein